MKGFPGRLRSTTRMVGLLLTALVGACQDSPTSGPPVPGPQFNVSEARFGGGNPDFFFSAPLAATPSASDPEFDVGGANRLLLPYLRVCETDGSDGVAGCITDVTPEVTGFASGLAQESCCQRVCRSALR